MNISWNFLCGLRFFKDSIEFFKLLFSVVFITREPTYKILVSRPAVRAGLMSECLFNKIQVFLYVQNLLKKLANLVTSGCSIVVADIHRQHECLASGEVACLLAVCE